MSTNTMQNHRHPSMHTDAQNEAIKALIATEPYKSFIRTDQINTTFFPVPPFEQKVLDKYRTGFKSLWEHLLRNPKGSPPHDEAAMKLLEATRKLHVARRDEMSKVQGQRQGDQGQARQDNVTHGTVGQANGESSTNGQTTVRQQAQPSHLPQQQQQIQPSSNSQTTNTASGEFPPDVTMQLDRQIWYVPANIPAGSSEADQYRKELRRRVGSELLKQRTALTAIKECDVAMQSAQQSASTGKDMTSLIASIKARRQDATIAAKAAHDFVEKMLIVNSKHQQPMSQANGNNLQGRNGPSQGQPPQQNQVPPHNYANSRPTLPAGSIQGSHGQNGDPPTKTYTPQQAVALSRSQAQPSSGQAPAHGAQPFQADRQPSQGDLESRRPGPQISKTWQPQPPQPVTMGPSRPTLAGPNNGPLGAMGAPAITKNDTFLLQGPGDRVLDKKKLDELVRQVCGADGGDGDALKPEVEEIVLQLADEFVDNVIQAACKLAKLRNSPYLEIRDLQLVLERQYNIRVPGYGTDEVRTVRKTQPAPGYYQKIQAVQAAKVIGSVVKNDV